MTHNETDLAEVVRNDYKIPESEMDGRYTKTTLFMLPAIGLSYIASYLRPFLVNSFLDDIEYDHEFVRPIFVLLRNKSFKELGWRKLYDTVTKNPNYLLDYDLGVQDDFNLVMCVFQCPDIESENYYHFRMGRYSSFSPTYKKKFSSHVPDDAGKLVDSIVYGVVNKSPELKRKIEKELMLDHGYLDEQDDIWGKPFAAREYYRYKDHSWPPKE